MLIFWALIMIIVIMNVIVFMPERLERESPTSSGSTLTEEQLDVDSENEETNIRETFQQQKESFAMNHRSDSTVLSKECSCGILKDENNGDLVLEGIPIIIREPVPFSDNEKQDSFKLKISLSKSTNDVQRFFREYPGDTLSTEGDWVYFPIGIIGYGTISSTAEIDRVVRRDLLYGTIKERPTKIRIIVPTCTSSENRLSGSFTPACKLLPAT